MGLTQGDYWVRGLTPGPGLVEAVRDAAQEAAPDSRAAADLVELHRCLVRAEELANQLDGVSIGYGYDLDNNAFDWPSLRKRIVEYGTATLGA